MTEEKPSQSLSISNSPLDQVQIAQIEGQDIDVTQKQQIGTNESSKQLTQADVVELIVQLEQLFHSSSLPEAQTAKAIRYLETTKDEVQANKPDKMFAAQNLKRATQVLREAGETLEAGTNLWQKVKPILETVSLWFGVAAGFFA